MKKHKAPHRLRSTLKLLLLVGLLAGGLSLTVPAGTAFAASSCPATSGKVKTGDSCTAPYHCGGGNREVDMSINIGCKGQGNALADAIFAIIRFLSIGVGVVVTASTVYAGIQYSMARDDPSQVSQAKGRIMNNFAALLIYIFAYAILNYLIPGTFLH